MNYIIITFSFFFISARLRIKIASKIEDEHKIVKDMPPPTEAVSKATAKILPGKTGTVGHLEINYYNFQF